MQEYLQKSRMRVCEGHGTSDKSVLHGVFRVLIGDHWENSDMDEILAGLLELRGRVVEDMRQGAEKELAGAEQRMRAETSLKLVDRIYANAVRLFDVPGGVDLPPNGEEGGCPSSDELIARLHAQRQWLFEGDLDSLQYLTPELDEETGAMVYDSRVVVGKSTNRLRALAVARVYGPRLKLASLADTLFRAGETRATDVASVKASLGGLTRYGVDWQRVASGWLEYKGEGLAPNREMILELLKERQERLSQAGGG